MSTNDLYQTCERMRASVVREFKFVLGDFGFKRQENPTEMLDPFDPMFVVQFDHSKFRISVGIDPDAGSCRVCIEERESSWVVGLKLLLDVDALLTGQSFDPWPERGSGKFDEYIKPVGAGLRRILDRDLVRLIEHRVYE